MVTARTTTRLVIAGSSIEVTHEEVPLTSLRLDPENPRIRLQVTAGNGKKPSTHEELLDLMRAQPGYDELHKQIRADGGLSDPLMVRNDGRIVEGNTRFTVLSVLAKTPGGAEKWGLVPIMRLPAGIPEKIIQLQLAGYHVSGKTRWRAAAQADHIYRLIEENKASIEEVAAATRMTPKQVQQNIDAYNYLLNEVIPELKGANAGEKREILKTKFSHAKEFITGRNLQTVRNDKEARQKVAKAIAEGKIKGAEVRKLDSVLRHPRAREALESHGFGKAREVLSKADPASESKVLKSIEKLTESISTLSQSDLELFLEHDKARDALRNLVKASEIVLDMTSRKGKRRA